MYKFMLDLSAGQFQEKSNDALVCPAGEDL